MARHVRVIIPEGKQWCSYHKQSEDSEEFSSPDDAYCRAGRAAYMREYRERQGEQQKERRREIEARERISLVEG